MIPKYIPGFPKKRKEEERRREKKKKRKEKVWDNKELHLYGRNNWQPKFSASLSFRKIMLGEREQVIMLFSFKDFIAEFPPP